jgi:AcrR family transcriptional regulator
MPKQVDHQQRRGQIAEAVWRIAADRGLEAVSMSTVAAEAGISIGRIQHYFAGKDELVRFAATRLRERIDERLRERIAATPEPHTPLTMLRAILTALLPLDPESRTEALVGVAVFFRALHEPELTQKYLTGQSHILAVLAEQLSVASRAGEVRPDLDVGVEARILVALASGLSSDLLLGHCSPAEAVAMIEHQLAHLA